MQTGPYLATSTCIIIAQSYELMSNNLTPLPLQTCAIYAELLTSYATDAKM